MQAFRYLYRNYCHIMRYLRADLPGDGLADEYCVEILVFHPVHLLEGGEPHLLHQFRVGVASAQQVASCHHNDVDVDSTIRYLPLVQRPNPNRKYGSSFAAEKWAFCAKKVPFQLIRIQGTFQRSYFLLEFSLWVRYLSYLSGSRCGAGYIGSRIERL
jgi:hypothetical protein